MHLDFQLAVLAEDPEEAEFTKAIWRKAANLYTEVAGDTPAKNRSEWNNGLRGARKVIRAESAKAKAKLEKGERRLVITSAMDTRIGTFDWLYDLRIGKGTLSLLAGIQGLGKSTLAAKIAAMTSTGTLPGDSFGTPKYVLFAATEDSWANVIVPRLVAAGADRSMCGRIEVQTSEDEFGEMSLPDDNVQLEAVIKQLGVGLLVLDPLMSRLHKNLDTHKDSDVRSALEPLTKIADRTGMAILGLMHFNKSGQTDPILLITGSMAFSSVARTANIVIQSPDDKEVRYFGLPKSNSGITDKSGLPSLGFTIEGCEIPSEDGSGKMVQTSKIVWGEETTETLQEMMTRAKKGPGYEGGVSDGSFFTPAHSWLVRYLGGQDWVDRTVVMEEGGLNGHTDKSIERARDAILKINTDTVVAIRRMKTTPSTTQWKLTKPERPVPGSPAEFKQKLQDHAVAVTTNNGHVPEAPAKDSVTDSAKAESELDATMEAIDKQRAENAAILAANNGHWPHPPAKTAAQEPVGFSPEVAERMVFEFVKENPGLTLTKIYDRGPWNRPSKIINDAMRSLVADGTFDRNPDFQGIDHVRLAVSDRNPGENSGQDHSQN